MGCNQSSSKKPTTDDKSKPFGIRPEEKKELHVVEHKNLNLSAAVCKMQGWRNTQEDRATTSSAVAGGSEYFFCGVFDGHSGYISSSHAAEVIFSEITKTTMWKENNIEQAIIDGYLAVDRQLRQACVKDGTTALCAIVGDKKIWVANCGDSRSVLCRDGVASALSVDHKPANPEETARIKKAGGYVDTFDPLVPRVMAPNSYFAMATSRTLGDFHFKIDKKRGPEEQIVSPVPTIVCVDRSPVDQFLVLATDGVWDVMTNQEVGDFLVEESAKGSGEDLPEDHIGEQTSRESSDRSPQNTEVGRLAKSLLSLCLSKESMDNCTVVLLDLRQKMPFMSGVPNDPLSSTDKLSSVENATTVGEAAPERHDSPI